MRYAGYVAVMLLGAVVGVFVGRTAPDPLPVVAQSPNLPPLPQSGGGNLGPVVPPIPVVQPHSDKLLPNLPPLPSGDDSRRLVPERQPIPLPMSERPKQFNPPPAPPVVVGPPVAPMTRAAVRLSGGTGMKVSWEVDGKGFHDSDLVAPASFNFAVGKTHRLRLSGHARFPERAFYPTLELAAATDRTRTFLAHCSVPIAFTDAELLAAADGRLVVKTVYLPQTSGRTDADVEVAEEVSSVRGGAPFDPTRGTPLAVVRFGNIDLETPHSPRLDAPPGADVPPAVAPLPHAR